MSAPLLSVEGQHLRPFIYSLKAMGISPHALSLSELRSAWLVYLTAHTEHSEVELKPIASGLTVEDLRRQLGVAP